MSDTMFSITIIRDAADGACQVVSVDINGEAFHHRLTFQSGDDLHAALVPELADRLRGIIADLPEQTTVFASPDTVVQMPGLVLARLRVLAHDLGQGLRKFTLRFKYFIGSLAAACKRQAYMAIPTLPHREAVAVNALEDVCLPACDLAALDPEYLTQAAVRDSLDARLQMLRERRDELYFHVELIKRFLGAEAQGDAAMTDQRHVARPLASA